MIIGVLTWNGYQLAKSCIQSLTTLTAWPVRTVVVDNGSTEPEGERLAREFGAPVEAVTMPSNQLVSGGYNRLMRAAVDRGATHVLLLNNDVVVDDTQLIEELLAASGRDVAVAGPLVLEEDGTLFSAGGRLGRWSGRSGHLRRREMPSTEQPYDVPWLDGPCMLVNIEAACRIGGLDPVYISTWEELDWCVRAGRAGFRNVVVPTTSIRHLRGRTIPASESQARLMRNALLFARRNSGLARSLSAVAGLLFWTLPEQMAFAFPDPKRMARVAANAFRALAWNLADAARRRSWRLPSNGPRVCGDDHR